MPREHRTTEEKLIDNVLLLSLLNQVSSEDVPYVGDRLKVMKLAFLATHRMFEAGDKGFNFTFYKWKHGPFSKHVCEAWDSLKSAALLKEEEEFSLTRRGSRLAAQFRREILGKSENQPFAAVIQDTVDKFGAWNHDDIIGHVYSMKVRPVGSRRLVLVRDVPEGRNLTAALTPGEARLEIDVDHGWVETLAIALNPRNAQSLRKAVDDFELGRVTVG